MGLFKRSALLFGFFVICCLMAAGSIQARHRPALSPAEDFDLSGLPPRPTNFVAQQIFEFVRTHQRGDLVNAALIQHKLAKYYADKGDFARAREAEHRAELAEGKTPSHGGERTPAFGEVPMQTFSNTPMGDSNHSSNSPAAGTPPQPSTSTYTPIPMAWELCEAKDPMFAGTPTPFTGIWYLYKGGSSEETWEFFGDSMFRHTWISAGVGVSARTSQRGRFRISGNTITFHITSQTGGSVSGSSSGGSLLTGGTQCKDETQHMSFRLLGSQGADGIVLNGAKIKLRSR